MGDRPMSERWLPVVGYDGWYEVSDLGRVRSLDRYIEYPNRVVWHPGVVLTPKVGGEMRVHTVILSRNSYLRTRKISALVAEAFIGPRPDGMLVRHLNDVQSDNRLSNLAYGTPSQNMYDRVRNGHHPCTARVRCPRNHLLAEPNLVAYNARRGHRVCLACARARARTQKRPDIDFRWLADFKYRGIIGPGGDPEWEAGLDAAA